MVGRGGAVVGAAGLAAGRELEQLLGRPVHLLLRVRVRSEEQQLADEAFGARLLQDEPGADGGLVFAPRPLT